MERPVLKYIYKDGHRSSEFVPVVIAGQSIEARLTVYQDGSEVWRDRNGLPLEQPSLTNGKENDQSRQESRQGDEGVQGGNPAQRQTGSRKRTSGKKPQTGGSNRAV